jgi:endonuclease V-like protein UPF0215 family
MDQNLLFNKNTRLLAIDDSPFIRGDSFTNIIGVIIRKDLYIENILKKTIQVDGMDVTDRIMEMVQEKGEGIRMIMIKGITFGGFNVLDMEKLYDAHKIPIINFMDHPPDKDAIEAALKKHFNDWEIRLSLMKGYSKIDESVYIKTVGIDLRSAVKFSFGLMKNGKIPEPLRIVDLIASIC